MVKSHDLEQLQQQVEKARRLVYLHEIKVEELKASVREIHEIQGCAVDIPEKEEGLRNADGPVIGD
jgi:hypothetical protein